MKTNQIVKVLIITLITGSAVTCRAQTNEEMRLLTEKLKLQKIPFEDRDTWQEIVRYELVEIGTPTIKDRFNDILDWRYKLEYSKASELWDDYNANGKKAFDKTISRVGEETLDQLFDFDRISKTAQNSFVRFFFKLLHGSFGNTLNRDIKPANPLRSESERKWFSSFRNDADYGVHIGTHPSVYYMRPLFWHAGEPTVLTETKIRFDADGIRPEQLILFPLHSGWSFRLGASLREKEEDVDSRRWEASCSIDGPLPKWHRLLKRTGLNAGMSVGPTSSGKFGIGAAFVMMISY